MCTLGPAVSTPEKIRALVDAGMDVARMNMSHGSHDDHARIYQLVRNAADEAGRSVGIFADLQGPKIRLERFGDGPVELAQGQPWTITTRDVDGNDAICGTTYKGLPGDVKIGDPILIDDGKASQVRYAEFAKDRAQLKAYLDSLSKVTESEFAGWSKPEQMAFLINAYNAFTIEKILTRYPDIKSIWDFGKVFGNPFKDRFFTLLGKEATLDRIEHETLRKKGVYDEPRVHFAVNCASIGCPMLREEAYVAERLEAQLEEQARRRHLRRGARPSGADR